MIEFENVVKTFPSLARPAVNQVSFEIGSGELFVLLGSSGCGKSTMLKLVNRLLEPDGGTVRTSGGPVSDRDPTRLRRSIGYVIQNVGLFPHWTVGENVASSLRIAGRPGIEREKRSTELLEMMGLAPEEYRDRYPAELSGGQQQRVGVARALAPKPEILLMDEPFGALDGITREDLQKKLLQIRDDLGTTILMVTHDLFEALALGDRIGVMHEGRLEQVGTKEELIREPETDFVRELFEKPAQQLEQFRRSQG